MSLKDSFPVWFGDEMTKSHGQMIFPMWEVMLGFAGWFWWISIADSPENIWRLSVGSILAIFIAGLAFIAFIRSNTLDADIIAGILILSVRAAIGHFIFHTSLTHSLIEGFEIWLILSLIIKSLIFYLQGHSRGLV